MMTKNTQTNLLKDKVAIITGANRGMGKVMCETFAAAGAHVLACARNLDVDFVGWSEQQSQLGFGKISTICLDLNDEESIKSAVKDVRSISKTIDVLVNNAAVPHGSLFQMTKISDLRSVFEVNFFAQIALSQTISRLMSRQKSGSIINISSSAAHIADAGTLVYGTSKAALNRATESMASELGAMGIRVNAIAPGVTETEMADQMDPAAREKLIQSSALKCGAVPQDIANTALFLASDLSSHITGQIIHVDGGIV